MCVNWTRVGSALGKGLVRCFSELVELSEFAIFREGSLWFPACWGLLFGMWFALSDRATQKTSLDRALDATLTLAFRCFVWALVLAYSR